MDIIICWLHAADIAILPGNYQTKWSSAVNLDWYGTIAPMEKFILENVVCDLEILTHDLENVTTVMQTW